MRNEIFIRFRVIYFSGFDLILTRADNTIFKCYFRDIQMICAEEFLKVQVECKQSDY